MSNISNHDNTPNLIPVHTVDTSQLSSQDSPFSHWFLLLCICVGCSFIGYSFGLADKGIKEYTKGFEDGYKQCLYDVYQYNLKQPKIGELK